MSNPIEVLEDLPQCHSCMDGFKGCQLGQQVVRSFTNGFRFTIHCDKYQQYKHNEENEDE